MLRAFPDGQSSGGIVLMAVAALALVVANRLGVTRLWAYLVSGVVLWWLVLGSGVHATVAGVLLALTVPLRASRGRPDDAGHSPLHRLEHALHPWSTFLVIPVFGFANAGVSFAGMTVAARTDGLTLGVALGLLVGKIVGVFGSAWALIGLKLADMPMGLGGFNSSARPSCAGSASP
jgi:NhaA family Na+:H+ antiporter